MASGQANRGTVAVWLAARLMGSSSSMASGQANRVALALWLAMRLTVEK